MVSAYPEREGAGHRAGPVSARLGGIEQLADLVTESGEVREGEREGGREGGEREGGNRGRGEGGKVRGEE